MDEPAQSQARRPEKSLAKPFFLSAEDVVLRVISLPNLSPGQRRAAAAFAVEDLLAQPLDQVRVVLGPQFPQGSGSWLVAVVDAGVLAHAVGQAGPSRPVLAETLLLPVPAVGWSVAQRGGRLLVRLADGSGHAVDRSLGPTLWRMQGNPALTGYGADLPEEMSYAARMPWPEDGGLHPSSFDLAAIAGRRPSYAKRSKWLWGAAFVALALVVHLIIAALDVYALQRLAAKSRQILAEAVAANSATNSATGEDAGEDPVSAATRVLAAQGAAAAPAFLSLATRAIGALPPPESGVTLRGLRFDEATGRLVLAVIAPDIATLQAIEAALGSAGLGVVSGPASSRNGAAEAEMTLTSGAAP